VNAASRLANELQTVLPTGGVMRTAPQYLDYCAAYSIPQRSEYRVCILQNQHGACSRWENENEKWANALKKPMTVELRTDSMNSGDPIDCAGYKFSLSHNTNLDKQLVVTASGTGERTRYDLKSLPLRKWITLGDNKGTAIPISIINHYGILKIQTGPAPQKELPLLIPLGYKPWNFELTIHSHKQAEHPEYPYTIRRFTFINCDDIIVRNESTGKEHRFKVKSLPHLRLGILKDENKQTLPLKVQHKIFSDTVVGEWLTQDYALSSY
jgi:hypothetical protein